MADIQPFFKGLRMDGVPNGNRTRVFTVKGDIERPSSGVSPTTAWFGKGGCEPPI